MNSKGQFVTVFFAVLLITVIVAIFSLEYNNLVSNQSLNLQQSNLVSSNAVAYNLLNQYSFLQSLGPSGVASSFATSSLMAIEEEFADSYHINFSYGLGISGSSESITSIPSAIMYIANTQSSPTPSPFQQIVYVNSSAYSAYEASDLQNVQFSYPNGTVIPSWIQSGNIATFNGVDSYVNSTFKTEKELTTLSFWFYPTSLPLTSTGVDILSSANSTGTGTTNGWLIEWDQNGSLVFGIYNGTQGSYNATILGNVTQTYQWYNLIVSYNPVNGSLSAYLDGKLWNFDGRMDSGLLSNPWSGNSTYNLLMGTGYSGKYFNGSIANIQIYDIKFNSNLANKLYTEGLAGQPLEGSLLLEGWWPMSGNSRDVIYSGYDGVNNYINFSTPGAASTRTVYWLKIAGIPAYSESEILMNFYPKQENLFNGYNTGEAPQFSKTPGGYDDGADVFDGYWNFFDSSAIPISLSQVNPSGSSITVGNNEIQINTTTANYAGLISDAAYPTPFIVEADVLKWTGVAAGVSEQSNGSANGAGPVFSGWTGGYLSAGGMSTGLTPISDAESFTVGVMGLAQISSSSVLVYRNFTGTSLSYSSSGLPPLEHISFGLYYSSPSTSLTLRWVRVRAYPPNGVMPTVLFEGIQ